MCIFFLLGTALENHFMLSASVMQHTEIQPVPALCRVIGLFDSQPGSPLKELRWCCLPIKVPAHFDLFINIPARSGSKAESNVLPK